MLGLRKIPTITDLTRAYESLRFSEPSLDEWVEWSQWTRFDARLAEIWIQALVRNWKTFNPLSLRHILINQPWPQVVGVLCEFAEHAIPNQDVMVFRGWRDVILVGVPPAPQGQYFIGLQPLGSQSMIDAARFSALEYKRWGFLGQDSLLPKSGRVTLSTNVRMQVLQDLMTTQSRITVTDYWNAIRRSVSRRQAERDLMAAPGLKPLGNTRGRVFVRKHKRLPVDSNRNH